MRIALSTLKKTHGSQLTGQTFTGVVEQATANKIQIAISAGYTVHVGARSIGDCIRLWREGRMIAQVNSRRHGKCERAIYTV